MIRPCLFLLACLSGAAQQQFGALTGEHWRGAALASGVLYTWGDRLSRWNLADGTHRVIAAARNGGFGEGGCVDAHGTVYLQDGVESGPLVALSPSGDRTELDPNVEMHDCIATVLLGHRGVLITDHYGQVRLYEGRGIYQEVYSFYTPSRQAGLLRADVDGDGLKDIFAGNYWIRSPREFDLPWRLFAVNTRHETPDSATMSLALRGRILFAAQGHMREGGVFRYAPPADPTQLWSETVVAAGLHFPHALVSAPSGVFVGENNGAGSRLFLAGDSGKLEQIGITPGIHTAFAIGNRVLAVGAETIDWWTVQRRK